MPTNKKISNFNGFIRMVIDRLPILLLLFVSVRDVFWKKMVLGRIYKYFLVMTYVLIYISYLFVGRDVSAFIAPRFWDASIFPFTLFLGGYLENKKATIYVYISFFLLIISKIFTYLYAFYVS